MSSSSEGLSPTTRPGTSMDGPNGVPRRTTRAKDSQFVFKYGKRHHSYDPEKAPYPLSYDKEYLELEAVDHVYLQALTGSCSTLPWPNGPPKHSLELGCGCGHWVVDAAKEWPECEFVGFDLMNVQIPLQFLEEPVAKRISWVHGNFLSNQLPFEDETFDHVYMRNCAKGIPETKWNSLFEEIARVLRPNGAIELLEEDIIFPTLPLWFTTPLRGRARRSQSVHLPDGQKPNIPSRPSTPREGQPPHDHALLESLYYSIFANRFINTKPSSLLPSYFDIYFTHVGKPPPILIPMPPIRPPPPLRDFENARAFANGNGMPSLHRPRPHAASLPSSNASVLTSDTMFTATSSTAYTPSVAISEETVAPPGLTETRAAPGTDAARPRAASSATLMTRASSSLSQPPVARDTTSSPVDASTVHDMGADVLGMHLHRVVEDVLACQEFMWEELKDRLRNHKGELRQFGWEDDEDLEDLHSRKKFETLLDRYRSDMHARVAMWSALHDIGWEIPAREAMSKAELIEEERIRQAMLEASRHAVQDEANEPCRTYRCLYGYKPDGEIIPHV